MLTAVHKFRLLPFTLSLLLAVPSARASEVRQTPIVRAVDRAQASVVNLHSERTQHTRETQFESAGEKKLNGMGTGIIIDERGYILTNHHVVARVETLRATLHDGASYDASIVDVDPVHDLAVVKIDAPHSLPVSPLGTSSDIRLGETVIAIGNALGYEHTVTVGIVSSLVRDVEAENQSYRNLLQTDAAINPGNSGGPLINLDGEVIAINVAIRANAQKIGFAIKIDDARGYAAQLLDIRRRNQTWHGIVTRDIKTPRQRHLVVVSCESASPAAQSGLQPDDVIVQCGTTRIEDGVDLERSLLQVSAGRPISVVVSRGGSPLSLNLAPAKYEGRTATVARRSLGSQKSRTVNLDDSVSNRSWRMLGLKLAPTSDVETRVVRERYNGGMRIIDVRGNSPAYQNGIRKGDILVGLHEFETKSLKDLEYILNKASNDASELRFRVLRGRDEVFGSLSLKAAAASDESTATR